MKRDELIAKLQELPEDADIVIEISCGCCVDEDDVIDLMRLKDNKFRLV